MSKNFVLTKKQLLGFILAFMEHRKSEPLTEESMTLSELLDKCLEDSMMFDSWFNGINVMD